MIVSVMPYRSRITCPVSACHSAKVCGLSGALPETKSRSARGRISGCAAASASRRMYIVGTPKNIVSGSVQSAR